MISSTDKKKFMYLKKKFRKERTAIIKYNKKNLIAKKMSQITVGNFFQ
jgi:hypothetical protein